MFEWKQEYALGISEIDRQHQELFRMADEIYDMVLEVSGDFQTQRIADLMTALNQYAEDHFALEESLLVRYEYPELEAHKREHDSFRLQVAELSQAKESQIQREVLTELIKFMTQWIFRHIRLTDAEYAPYLKAKLH